MISVCMAVYNGFPFVEKQIQSILQQLGDQDELIISDNGSTDQTIDIIKSFNDKRIIFLNYFNMKSPVFNFENALKNAKGDYIYLSDQDDIWCSTKIQTTQEFLQRYDLVLSDASIIDENGDIIYDSFFKLNGSKKGFIKNIVKNSYIGCTMAFNRKILERSLPFPKDLPMHDWWIGLIAEIYGKTYFIEDKLVMYRRHSKNASFTSEKSRYSLIKKIEFRGILIKNLILRYVGLI